MLTLCWRPYENQGFILSKEDMLPSCCTRLLSAHKQLVWKQLNFHYKNFLVKSKLSTGYFLHKFGWQRFKVCIL